MTPDAADARVARLAQIEAYLREKTGDPWERSARLEEHAEYLLALITEQAAERDALRGQIAQLIEKWDGPHPLAVACIFAAELRAILSCRAGNREPLT